MTSFQKSSKIIIIGSGVFGLSTALWLAKGGYTDVTVLDMQDTASASYSPSTIDSASADLNKIIRFSYGAEIDYQRLATEAAGLWEEWNEQIEKANAEDLPPALRGEGDAAVGEGKHTRKLWWNSGMLRMSITGELGRFEMETLKNMEMEGIRHMQFRTDDPEDVKRATERGWAPKLDPCKQLERYGKYNAVLDSTAGFVIAYRSCAWARFLAEKAGVKFILDPTRGKVTDIKETSGDDGKTKPVVVTADGTSTVADLVVVAGGGWTPSLLPEVSDLLETTGGSVATVTIPSSRPDLRERFGPDKCPVLSWGMRGEKGIYSLPVNEDGILKIGYRGTKWTNFDDVNGRRISVPKTAHVTEKKETNVPMKALDAIKEFITFNLPELIPFGISSTKLCWYTDSIDNSFLVDYIPNRPGVAVCSGGSGHGFKFLPILGREVVKILEGKGAETPFGKMWGWRESHPKEGNSATNNYQGKARNGLEEGEDGPRVLGKLVMATEADWKI